MKRKTVLLFDVDNTLLDNDRVTADLRDHLEREVGHERQERYWSIFEELRAEVGYADYLGALQRYRANYPRDLHVLTVSHFPLEYPFRDRLFPYALEVVNGPESSESQSRRLPHETVTLRSSNSYNRTRQSGSERST